MSLAAARPLAPWRWLGLPMLYCVIWTVLFAVPIRVWTLSLPQPAFPMVLVFAWAVIRPSILAPFAVLLIGLFCDIFWGGPMGLWAVSLLIAYAAVFAARSILAGQSFFVMWAWFGVACAIAEAAGVLLARMQANATPSALSVGSQLLFTVILYPFAHRLIDRFEDADVRFR